MRSTPYFHVSLLKQFCVDKFQLISPTDEPSIIMKEINEPYYKVEKILRWRRGRVPYLWAGYPLEDASWKFCCIGLLRSILFYIILYIFIFALNLPLSDALFFPELIALYSIPIRPTAAEICVLEACNVTLVL